MDKFNNFINSLYGNKKKTSSSSSMTTTPYSSPLKPTTTPSQTYNPTSSNLTGSAYYTNLSQYGNPEQQSAAFNWLKRNQPTTNTPTNKPTTNIEGNQSATSPTTSNQTLPPSGNQYINLLSNSSDSSQSSPFPPPTQQPQQPVIKEDPYKKYLDSLFDTKKLGVAQGNIDALNKRTSDELLRTREREDELRKNEIGQLERGQQYQLGEEQRLSNKSLADLAIAKGASIDTINQIMAAGKESYEMSQPINVGGVLYQKGVDGSYTPLTGMGASAEGFTLGKDQIRYDAQGNVIASGVSGGVGGGEAPIIKTFGQSDYAWNPQTEQWDPVKLSDISPQLKIDKAQGVIDIIRTLGAEADGFSGAVGFKGPAQLWGLKGKPIAGTNEAGFISRLNQLTGMLTLENMGVMKGVLSDADIKIIQNASTALNSDLKEEDFIKELGKLEEIMNKVIQKGGVMDSTSGSTSGGSSGGQTGGGGLYDW